MRKLCTQSGIAILSNALTATQTKAIARNSRHGASSTRRCVAMKEHFIGIALALVVLAGGCLICTELVHSREAPDDPNRAVLAFSALPPEGQQTYRLIRQGGPFPYEKDGSVFGNRERQLPRQARGYYREYTVRTPGARDRGARRMVCGGEVPVQPVACYYTADHYASFRRIVPPQD